MVKQLLKLCKVACVSGLFVLPNHKRVGLMPHSILRGINPQASWELLIKT